MSKDVRLTRLAKCAGCGAKVGAGTLVKLLGDLPTRFDENLLVGFDKSDDACVYKISEEQAIVQTLDFFPPIVDEPYLFGQIAACNALSDVYAMGGEPKLVLNIMAVTENMEEDSIHEILRGGYEKAYEAGAIICGGHTIHNESPLYGMSVTGFANPNRILANASARPGDVLILTKPLGVGVLTTSAKAGLVSADVLTRITTQMATLNKLSRNDMVRFDIHSCTDVTGFALMGHGYEMASGSGVTIHYTTSTIKYHKEAWDFADMGFIPAGAYKNRDYVGNHFTAKSDIARPMIDIMFDPQTSGGLLISVAEKDANALLAALQLHTDAAIVGYVTERSDYDIVIE